MNQIKDLIAELSPKGVPFRPMGEVGRFFRGRRFTKNDRVPTGIPSIHYGEIYTNYGTAARTALSHVREEIDDQLRYAEHGDVVFASVGETVEDVGKAVAWLGKSRVAIHDDCFAFRSEQDPVFVAYFSQTAAFKSQIERHVARAKVKRVSARSLARVEIPVPPLDVQREIVRVLDVLTQLRTELEANLRVELAARGAQFEHYRNALLTFPSGGGGGSSVDAIE